MTKKEREEKMAQRLIEMTQIEKKLYADGVKYIGGVDEVGRGCLAGPVCAACVVLPEGWDIPGIDDSKKLSEARREDMYQIIKENSLAMGVAMMDNKYIDLTNIVEATKVAMQKAIMMAENDLCERIDHILIDAVSLEKVKNPQTAIVKGDQKSISIAAASIVAKVTRDDYMRKRALEYPEYGWERNKGYGTKEHYAAIKEYGICSFHRKTFLKNFDY